MNEEIVNLLDTIFGEDKRLMKDLVEAMSTYMIYGEYPKIYIEKPEYVQEEMEL